MNADGFRLYLQEQHSSRAGHSFSPKVASDCVSRCRRVETVTGEDLDDLVKRNTPEAVADVIDGCRDPTVGPRVLSDLKAAARRYHEYRHQSAN